MNEWMNEWMKWLLIYHLLSGQWPHLKAVYSTYHRFIGLPTWVEQSKTHIYGQLPLFPPLFIQALSSLFFHYHLFSFFHCPHIFFLHFYCVWWVSVCNGHFLNTNYYRTTFGGVPGSLIPCQFECMCDQNRPRFIVPSEWLSNEAQVPCLKGIHNYQQKSCFLLSLPVLPQLV